MIKSLLKKVKRKLKYLYRKYFFTTVTSTPEKQAPYLIFVFGGRTQYWSQMGKELYASESVFRETIKTCDTLTKKINGISILSHFESENSDTFFDSEGKITITISAIEIALYHLWKSKNITPDAVMGVSSGEAIAFYAAGAVTLEDVFRIFSCSVLITELDKKDCITLFLFVNMEQAIELCKDCPVWVAPVYDAGAEIVLLYCKVNQTDSVLSYFKSKNKLCRKVYNELFWPFHTDLIHRHEKMILDLIKNITTQPIQIDYYSCTTGELMPKNSIVPATYLYDTLSKPVLINPTVTLIKGHKSLTMVHLGPYFFLKTQIQNILVQHNQNVVLFDPMTNGSSEKEEFYNTLTAIQQQVRISVEPETDPLSKFLESFSLSNQNFLNNPYPVFDYLRSNGTVYYIPNDNAWLILSHDEINDILKKPAIFSSKILSGFDHVLIGNDPPAHTVVRTLLQPSFSPRAFEKLGRYALKKANELLDGLKELPEFDMVNQFSIPLAQAVIAHFLGIDVKGAEELKKIMSNDGHTYHMNYLGELDSFFHGYMEAKKGSNNEEDLGSQVAKFVEDGNITFDESVCLMRTLWIAGMTTTSMLLSASIDFLIKYPEIALDLKENDKLIPKFIEECLRLEAPESELKRITTQEVILANKVIPTGSVIILSIRAANRESKYYPDPNEFSLYRDAKRNLSFGGGYHYCLGIGIARTEAQYAIKAVLEKFPYLKKSNPQTQDIYFPSPHFRGLERLMVTNN